MQGPGQCGSSFGAFADRSMSMLLAVKTGRPNRVVLGARGDQRGVRVAARPTSPVGVLETPVSGLPPGCSAVARRRIGVEEEADLVAGLARRPS